MEKVIIKIEINNQIINGIGLLKDKVLVLNKNNEKYKFNLDTLVFEKENKELAINIDFTNKKLKYKLLELNSEFLENFVILSLTKKPKKYSINYQMEESIFNLKIEYEKYEYNK